MILGTFESSAFTGVWEQGLFLSYSFLVVIILLNVLIAIVGDSYDAVLVTSTELFWRSRLELIAEISSTFKWLLQGFEVWKKRFDDHGKRWFGEEGWLLILYGLKEDHAWANGKNKVALGVRILFSPVLLGSAIAIFFTWFLPLKACGAILEVFAKQTSATTSTEDKLDLKLDSSNSDWTGRVLDIVRRVNKKTTAEFVKLEAKMTAEIHALRDENDNLKKLLSDEMKSNKKETKLLKNMLMALVKKAGAEVEHDEDDDEEDETTPDTQQKDESEEEKSEDPDSPPPPPPPPAASSNIESDPNTVQNPMIQEPGLELSTLK
ncbi:hypothetical protein TrST_g8962 [Triparma strigata]|nr:hypothetical protein TrST_g8962 [Triparma strigata]